MTTKVTKQRADQIRSQIQGKLIVNRLQDHLDGKVEMNSAQVRSATALLGKILPDEQNINLNNGSDVPVMSLQETNEKLVDAVGSLPVDLAAKAFKKLCHTLPKGIRDEIIAESITCERGKLKLEAVN